MTRTFDCAACQELLAELICDELAPDDRAVVLAHTRSCGDCARNLGRLRQVMDVANSIEAPAPSAALRERIMADAREALARTATRAPARSSRPPGLGGFFARLGDWAMSPQVAMASVLLLVVGIGLYAIPFSSPAPTASVPIEQRNEEGPAAAAPVPSTPAAPIGATENSQPASREEAKTASSANEMAKVAARSDYASDTIKGTGGSARRAKQDHDDRLALGEGAGKSTQRSRSAAAPAPFKKESGKANGDLALDELSGTTGQGFAPPPPSPVATTGPADAEDNSANVQPETQAAAKPAAAEPAVDSLARAASQETERSAGAAGPAPTPASTLAQGIAAAQAGKHAEAVKLLVPALKSTQPGERGTAALWLARSYARRGDCAAAKRYFNMAEAAGHSAKDAATELAKCTSQKPSAARPTKP